MRIHVKHLAVITVVALLIGRVMAAVPLAEWYTGTATLHLPAGWQTALNNRGRSAAKRRGNDLYLDNGFRDLYVSGPVFSNGQYKARRGLAVNLLCRTSLHVIMGNDRAAHLILAAHILGEPHPPSEASIRGRIPRRDLSVSLPQNCQIAARLDPKRAPCLLCSLLANATLVNTGHVFTADEITQIQDIYDGLLLEYNTRLTQYRGWANREFGAVWADVPLDPRENTGLWPFHTEIMLLYDYRERPLPQKVYSRFSMCKSCEPALVRAAGRDEVCFISRCVYNKSYVAGKTHAWVQKAVVDQNGGVIPIGSIHTIGGPGVPRNLANPVDRRVFGGKTWLAES